MEDTLIKQIRGLSKIGPDPSFARKSRSLVLGFEHPKRAYMPVWSFALSGIALFCLVVLASYYMVFKTSPVYASLNSENINQEFNDLGINIQLQEISYQQNNNQAISSALREIKDSKIKHLNSSLLESEDKEMNVGDATNADIDDLLNDVLN
ncbi:MAG: hypothetical protein AAB617_00475 [Patescibacteria group bacterium]